MPFEYDLGFLGGGQLARMSIQAAQRMGLRCLSLDPGDNTPASQVAESVTANLDDVEALTAIFVRCARVTLENEFVPAKSILKAMQAAGRDREALIPSLETLALIQDKLLQRKALHEAKVPCPHAVPLEDDGTAAVSQIGFPMVLKARFGGYDGKGTRYARTAEELEVHRTLWESGGWLAESFVNFKRELAVMVYIDQNGDAGCFPTMETIQTNHVCDLVFPAESDASAIAIGAVMAVGGVGLFGVELFETATGEVLVNEIAPRPHNSGHFSLDWGGASQFDQHVRVALGLPPAPLDGTPTAMANLLGHDQAGDFRRAITATLRKDPSVRIHWYGKVESRTGRKMGHINASGPDARAQVEAAREVFYKAYYPNSPGRDTG